MKLPVRVSRRAKRDISKILTWIADRSLTGAQSWLTVLERTLAQLPEDAASSAMASEAADLGIDLRQRYFRTRKGNLYRLLFTIQAEAIHVLAVRGTGQDLLTNEDIEHVE
ncbi:MAG TPA: type II toxin-antitoxin system RelE/ParE family toxin [Schlesneria sp.]|jgi:plasmid stabilization system protein ParE